MANQNWVSLLSTPTYVQAANLTTAATQIMSPTTGVANQDIAQVNAAGQYLGWSPGLILRITAFGYLTTTASSGTLAFTVQSRIANAGTTYVTLAAATAFNTGTGSLTACHWGVECFCRCTAINKATGASVSSQGRIFVGGAYATAGTIGTANVMKMGMGGASGENAATVDTSQVQGINLQVAQVTSTCTVSCTQWFVEALT